MKDSFGTYDGSRPEPPYNATGEMQRMGQDVIDQISVERYELAEKLAEASLRRDQNHETAMGFCARVVALEKVAKLVLHDWDTYSLISALATAKLASIDQLREATQSAGAQQSETRSVASTDSASVSSKSVSTMDYGGVGQVGCERDDGTLNVHGYDQTCEVCASEPRGVE
jgi:hypothetical protein